MAFGEQSVMIRGIVMTHRLFAENLASKVTQRLYFMQDLDRERDRYG